MSEAQTPIEQALAAAPVGWIEDENIFILSRSDEGAWKRGRVHVIGGGFIRTSEITQWEAESHMCQCWREKLEEYCDKNGLGFSMDWGGFNWSVYVGYGRKDASLYEAPTLVEALAQAIVGVYGKDGG